jgi:glycosyltransferase involved in cell wall biosynthesis
MLERSPRDTASSSLTDDARRGGEPLLEMPPGLVQASVRSGHGVSRAAIQLISTGGFYGAERMLLELARYLAECGWESHVVALEGAGAPELVRRAQDVGLSAISFSDGNRLGTATLLRRLRATLDRHPGAIVHAHGYKADILLSWLGAPRRFGCVATCHTWYSDTLKMRLFERLDKRLLRRFDRVVAVSEEIRTDLLESGVAPGKVSRIANGISVPQGDAGARDRIRRELGIGPSEPLVVQIGRLAKSKRSDLLLEAAARLAPSFPVRVLLVGEGGEHEVLLERARCLGIVSRVTFTGYREDPHGIMAAADVLALTSNKEGLPIVILEAMALGCPIVSTAVGAIPSVLHRDETAWIVPIDDLDALTGALSEALGNPALARARAERAKADFGAHFDRDVMGRCYLELYEQIRSTRG